MDHGVTQVKYRKRECEVECVYPLLYMRDEGGGMRKTEWHNYEGMGEKGMQEGRKKGV